MKFLVTALHFITISTCLIFFGQGWQKVPSPLLWPIPHLLLVLSVMVYFRSTLKEIAVSVLAGWCVPLALIALYLTVMTEIGRREMSRMIREPLPEITIPSRERIESQFTQVEIR